VKIYAAIVEELKKKERKNREKISSPQKQRSPHP
jgi:hypothetical protein